MKHLAKNWYDYANFEVQDALEELLQYAHKKDEQDLKEVLDLDFLKEQFGKEAEQLPKFWKEKGSEFASLIKKMGKGKSIQEIYDFLNYESYWGFYAER